MNKWELLCTPPDYPLHVLWLCPQHQIHLCRQPERTVIDLPFLLVLGRSPGGLSPMSPLEVQMDSLPSGSPGPLFALLISTTPPSPKRERPGSSLPLLDAMEMLHPSVYPTEAPWASPS